ncbi:MAG: putative fatty acid-CoA racemase [Deltaproteobacteria bacterium]|nr:putative fatty acid-CoA racemase [Deltaproteobacteria bacterium]
MNGPLSGFKVLEVAQWWFVPAAGAVLADWGADVLKIEHPVTGDPQRGLAAMGWKSKEGNVDFMMQQSNRGKRSVGLDIATPGGRELLYRLAKDSDVFVTSFLPDARRRLEIDVEHIRAVNPKIVYVRGSGQGPHGPDNEKGGYDATAFWSRGGIGAALTPTAATDPVMQRPAFGDSIAALTLAGGVAAALLRRERSGVAGVVDVSLLNTAMWVLAPDIVACGLVDPDRWMPPYHRATHFNPVTNAYRTQDQRWIMLVMLQASRHWPDFCRHIDRPELIDDPRFATDEARFANREACIAELDKAFALRTLDEWRAKLATMEGPWATMQTPAEIRDDPQALSNGYLPEVDGGDKGRFRLVGSPVQFDEQTFTLRPSPEMGQHTEEVLLERGLSWEEIAALKEAGAIL